MIHYKDVTEAQKLFECLAAPVRAEILKLVLSHKADSLDYLAKTLHLTNGAITQHVKKLCDAGLIKLVEMPGKRGTAKRCVPAVDRVILDLATDLEMNAEQVFDIKLGSFSVASVNPYCGIATPNGWLGERDDPRYFTYPDRTDATLIYFNSGRLGWTLPAPQKKQLKSISLSFEISSKPYGYGRTRDSLVTFFINDVKLGEHTVDGEFTDRKGLFCTPDIDDVCRYGKLKTITVNELGTFLDGIQIGGATVNSITTDHLGFYISTENGIALFGSDYGDYGRGIRLKFEYV